MTDSSALFIAAPLARDVIVAEGPDAATFLQGQLSQDVAAMPVDSSKWSLLLAPTGKVEAWLRVTREGDDHFLLDVDAGFIEPTLARLQRFLLRTKVTFTPIPASGVHGWALRGTPNLPPLDGWEPPEDVFFDAPLGFPTIAGRDVLATAPFEPPPGARLADAEALDRLRIMAGVPAMGAEITGDVIPAELGQWLIDESVSFTKGCYTGQELVARIDSRGGNVPRHLRVLRIAGGTEVDVGAAVFVEGVGEAGRITSATSATSGDHQIALGFLKRAVEVPCDATVITAMGARGAEVLR